MSLVVALNQRNPPTNLTGKYINVKILCKSYAVPQTHANLFFKRCFVILVIVVSLLIYFLIIKCVFGHLVQTDKRLVGRKKNERTISITDRYEISSVLPQLYSFFFFFYLIGILHDEVLAVWLGQAQVDNTSQNAPSIVDVQVNLSCKFVGLVCLCSENNMLHVVARVFARNITKKAECIGIDYMSTKHTSILGGGFTKSRILLRIYK